MNDDIQSRKWLLTINNPIDKGFTLDVIKDLLLKIKNVSYYCISDEIGIEEQTYHTHIFFYRVSAVRFSTIKKLFPSAHIDYVKGTAQQNKDYVFKIGKWEKDKKNDTNLKDTHYEYGDLPQEMQGSRNDLSVLYDMIKDGISNNDIIELSPQYLFNVEKIESARQMINRNKFSNIFRNVETTYVFGSTGTGKTRNVMEKYGYCNVYRVTNYLHPFDAYNGQDIVIFEEFRSSLKCHEMLNYLDGYPVDLPSRYADKVACFTKVFIITNIELEKQFISIQDEHKETFNAFLRRIDKVKEYSSSGVVEYSNVKDYLNRSLDIYEQIPLQFQ